MAKSRAKSSKGSSGGGIWLGLFIGLGIAIAAYLLYTHSEPIRQFFAHGSSEPEQSTAAKPTANGPANTPSKTTRKLTAAMAKAAKDAPFAPSEDVFEAGAHIYAQQCATCHGTPKHDSHTGLSMHPAAAQYWSPKHDDTLAHLTAPEVYEAIAQGDMAKGMPAYGDQLTDTEIWQLTLLLRSSRLEMPMPVLHILDGNGGK